MLLGETEFEIGDVSRPITTWLTLSDSRHNSSPYGELMFSLSYLPTAERLTVVVVKARNLKLNEDQSNNPTQNVFVKVTTLVALSLNELPGLTKKRTKQNYRYYHVSGVFIEKRQKSIKKKNKY